MDFFRVFCLVNAKSKNKLFVDFWYVFLGCVLFAFGTNGSFLFGLFLIFWLSSVSCVSFYSGLKYVF